MRSPSNYIKIFLIFFLICFSIVLFAQPGIPGNPDSDPDNAVPIPGILYLLAGGLILGVRKLYKNNHKRDN